MMMHESYKLRKTTAEAELLGIHMPGCKIQTHFHKNLPHYYLRNGGIYMGRGLGEGMEKITPVVTIFQQWGFYFFFSFMFNSFLVPVAKYAAMI